MLDKELSLTHKSLLAFIFSLLLSIGVVILSQYSLVFSTSDFRTIVLSTVGLTSLYIAWQKFVVQESHKVQFHASLIRELVELEDGEVPIIEGIEWFVVNIGNNPITVHDLPFFYIQVNEEEIILGYRINRLNKPVNPGTSETFVLEDVNARAISTFDPTYIDSTEKYHKTSLLGAGISSGSYPDLTSQDSRKLDSILWKLPERIKESEEDIIQLGTKERIPLDKFRELSEEDIIEGFFEPHPITFEPKPQSD